MNRKFKRGKCMLLEGELEQMIKYLTILHYGDESERGNLPDSEDLENLYFFIKNKIVSFGEEIRGMKCAKRLMDELQASIFRYMIISAPFPIYGRKLEPVYRTLILNEYFKYDILPLCNIEPYVSLAPDYGAIEVMRIIDDGMKNKKVIKFNMLKDKMKNMNQESRNYLLKRLKDYKFLQELTQRLQKKVVRLNEKDNLKKIYKVVEQDVSKLFRSKSPLELVSFLNKNDNKVQMNVKTISNYYTYIPNMLSKELIFGALVLLSNSYLSFQIFNPDRYMLTFDTFEDMLKLALKEKPVNMYNWFKDMKYLEDNEE